MLKNKNKIKIKKASKRYNDIAMLKNAKLKINKVYSQRIVKRTAHTFK